MQTCCTSRGFTLIEMLVVISVLAIIASAAIPAMTGLLARSSTDATTRDLVRMIRATRSAAISSGRSARLCPVATDGHCIEHGSPDLWQQGWMMLTSTATGLEALRYAGKPADGILVIGTRPFVRFQSDGTAGGSNITFIVCDSRPTAYAARVVIVSNIGRIRSTTASATQAADCRSAD